MLRTLALALLLLIPGVSAGWGATNEGGHERYIIDVFSFVRNDPPAGEYFDREITLTIPHGYAVENSTALMHFTYSTTVGSTANGVWRFSVFWDDVLICLWDIETTSTLTNTIGHPLTGIWCPLTDAQLTPGIHDFRVSRAAQSGSPAALSHETFSSHIERTDLLEPNMTNEILDVLLIFAPLLMAVFLTWLALKDDYGITALMLHIGAIIAAGVYVVAPGAGFEDLRLPAAILMIFNAARATLTSMAKEVGQ